MSYSESEAALGRSFEKMRERALKAEARLAKAERLAKAAEAFRRCDSIKPRSGEHLRLVWEDVKKSKRQMFAALAEFRKTP